MTIQYKSEDGLLFDNEKNCLEHENKINRLVKDIKSLLESNLDSTNTVGYETEYLKYTPYDVMHSITIDKKKLLKLINDFVDGNNKEKLNDNS